MKPETKKTVKVALCIFLPTLFVALAAAWISVFTRWNAMFYFAALLVIGLPAVFGIAQLRATKDQMRKDMARSSKLMFAIPPPPDSRQERLAFAFRRCLGWTTLAFAVFVVIMLARDLVLR